MKRALKDSWGFLLVIVAVGLIYACLPLGTALQFGADEGYQLSAGLLCSKGYVLYKQIWYDHPPLFILLVSWTLKLLGSSVLGPRLMAAGFGLILFGAFYQLIKQRSGDWIGLVATFFLIASPGVLKLSVSVMQEIPAFALGLISVWLLSFWRERRQWYWAMVSGTMMGVAMGIKLTVLLLAPALFFEIIWQWRSIQPPGWQKRAIVSFLQWLLGAVMVFAVINLIWGRGSALTSLKSHLAEHPVLGQGSPADFPPSLRLLFNNLECVFGMVAGVGFVASKKRWREFSFPIVIALTVSPVHALHRPWWTYYYVHFAIPMAWLSGLAVVELIFTAKRLFSLKRMSLTSIKMCQAVVLCGLVAAAVTWSEGRLASSIRLMRRGVKIDADPVVAKMKEYAGGTHWVYAGPGKEIYAFQAGLLIPPELAIVMLKRYWSGQITEDEITRLCEKYQVEQVLLNPRSINADWKPFLERYELAYQDTNNVLSVAKRIER